jgi:hypothetical protein
MQMKRSSSAAATVCLTLPARGYAIAAVDNMEGI